MFPRTSLLIWSFAIIILIFGKSDKQFGAIKVNASIMVGGLFPVHDWNQSRWNSAKECGKLLREKGMQRLEAMLYAIDQINANPANLNGLKLGVHILDTCSKDQHAFRVGFDFIRLAMSDINQAHDLYQCSDSSKPVYTAPKPVAAVIGAASSEVSVQVANLLGQFQIPQISYSSTGTKLSDTARYGFFSRVVPPDNLQANAMVDVCKKLNWNLVHAIADTGSYGELGINKFMDIAKSKKNNIFIDNSVPIIIKNDWTSDDFDKMIKIMKGDMPQREKPLKSRIARGVVMFVGEKNARKILESLRRLTERDSSYEGHFMFVASDSWGAKTSPVLGVEDYAVGAITIAPKQVADAGFDDYFLALNPKSKQGKRNVWFEEFWHDLECTSENTNLGDCFKSVDYKYKQESYVSYVIKAVNTLAYAINESLEEDCESYFTKSTECDLSFEGKKLQNHYRNNSFQTGEPPLIDDHGDGIGEYIIYQYTFNFTYNQVGQWRDGSLLHFDLAAIQSGLAFNSSAEIPQSLCSRECDEGENKNVLDQARSVCWTCMSCYNQDDINDKYVLLDEFVCYRCVNHTIPNQARNECEPLVAETIEWSSPWAIAPAFFSIMGISATAVVVFTFVRYNKTPVIMASGRELCYFMIIGIACTYMMTFVLVAPPSIVTCAMVRVGLGLSLACIYAAILTKTSRLARVFRTQIKSTKAPKYISPMSQVLICGLLVSVQLIAAIAWLIKDNPATVTIYNDLDTHAVLSCSATATAMLMSLLYNVILIVACTFYAFKTRKIPENFNETKYIGFTMYATCIIWLAFIPIYFATMDQFRIQVTSFSVCISLSGTVALGCFFAPKVYICLFQPEKNVRTKGAVKALFSQQMAVLRTMTDARNFTQSSMPGFMSAGGQLAQMAVHVHRDEDEEMDASYRQTTDEKATSENTIINNNTAGSNVVVAPNHKQNHQQQLHVTKTASTTPRLSTISANATISDDHKAKNDLQLEQQPGQQLQNLPNTTLTTIPNNHKPAMSPIEDDLCAEEDQVLGELTPFLHCTEPLTNGYDQYNHHHHSNAAYIDKVQMKGNESQFEVRMRKSRSMPADVIVTNKTGKSNNSVSFTSSSSTGNSDVAMERILNQFAAKKETFL